MQVAAGMMRACLSTGGNTCRLMLFVGGPCTEGPGKVVSRELTEHMRSHKVIQIWSDVELCRIVMLEGLLGIGGALNIRCIPVIFFCLERLIGTWKVSAFKLLFEIS